METQLELEANMVAAGTTSYFHMENKRATSGRAADVGAPAFMVTLGVNAVIEGVNEYLLAEDTRLTERGGFTSESYNHIKPLGADLAGAVALKTMVNWLCRPGKSQVQLTSIAHAIGEALDNEAMVVAFAEKHKSLVKQALAKLDQTTSHEGHRRRVIMALMRKQDFEPVRWGKKARILVGMRMIEIISLKTGLIETELVRIGRETPQVVRFKEDALAILSDKRGYFSRLTPTLGPCVVPPKDWDARGRDGGYYSPVSMVPMKLVRAAYRELIPGDIVEATNTLQRTAWKVNAQVMDVMQTFLTGDRDDLGVLPPLSDVPIPSKPDDIETNEEARKAYRIAASGAYAENAKRKSKRIMVYRTLGVSEQYKDFPAIYFPHSLDFRGRVYPISQWLHPQGPDFVKGQLTFAEGKPIGDGQGPGWMAIHGANCFGVDKVSLEERIDWTEQHSEEIKRVASDPLQCLWWTEADSPWCFLAFCFEWAAYTVACEEGHGADFVSHLPVMVDGSCNGIQHFSAMLRDSVGGRATNLVPSDRPSDIYGTVSERVIERLRELPSDIGAKWIAWGINRKITKRSVMVLPYGGTFASCRDYVQEAVMERGDTPWAHDREAERKAINELAKVVWHSISDVVIGARTAMSWLQSMARLVFKNGAKSIWWRTPTGLKVTQRYNKFEQNRIETSFLGRIKFRATVMNETNTPDASQHVNGFSPNFVHSLDASALMLTILLASDNGVTSFAAVHDSYGTHAADMQTLAACIRTAFVNLYEENDVLGNLHADIIAQLPEGTDVPPPPEKGNLNLQEVLNSDFFFA
jgi:DNA-directed RNA polymerase